GRRSRDKDASSRAMTTMRLSCEFGGDGVVGRRGRRDGAHCGVLACVWVLVLPLPGNRCLHAFWADWNCGELGSRSPLGLPLISRPPEAFGSGKSVIPWSRMHFANLRASARRLACCAGAGAGSSDLHASWAAWNCALLGSRSLLPGPP